MASLEICMQVKKQHLELDMEQQTASKLGNEYAKAVCCHPVYLSYMQNTSSEMPDWVNHNLESKFWEKCQHQICRRHHPYGKKQRGTEEPLDESERGD